MNLNDPFGRMSRRDEREYQSLRTALKNEGVNSPKMVEAVLLRVRSRAVKTVVVVLAVVLVSLVFFPEYSALSIVVGALILLWVAKVMIVGRRHIKRYVKEELTDHTAR